MKPFLRPAAYLFLTLTAACAFAQNIPTDEQAFTEHFAGLLRKEIGGTPVTVRGPLTLSFGETQANLHKVFAFCRSNGAGCASEIDRNVKGMAQLEKERSAPPTKAAVRLVIRDSQFVQAWIARSPDIQPRPFVEGLSVLPVLDSPRTIRMLNERDNKALGLTADEVFQLGEGNLDTQLKPLMDVARPVGAGQIGEITGDPFHHARLIKHANWAPLAQAQGGNLIVAAPATDTVLYIGETNTMAVDALRARVRDVTARNPRRLSDTLLRWTPAGWEVVR